MLQVISETTCKELKSTPIKAFARKTSAIINSYKDELVHTKLKLLVLNPICPRLYGVRKAHKPGNQTRPVCSNINDPKEKMANWLVCEF